MRSSPLANFVEGLWRIKPLLRTCQAGSESPSCGCFVVACTSAECSKFFKRLLSVTLPSRRGEAVLGVMRVPPWQNHTTQKALTSLSDQVQLALGERTGVGILSCPCCDACSTARCKAPSALRRVPKPCDTSPPGACTPLRPLVGSGGWKTCSWVMLGAWGRRFGRKGGAKGTGDVAQAERRFGRRAEGNVLSCAESLAVTCPPWAWALVLKASKVVGCMGGVGCCAWGSHPTAGVSRDPIHSNEAVRYANRIASGS
jgi:hypothetical protein